MDQEIGCCVRVLDAPLSENEADAVADAFKALAWYRVVPEQLAAVRDAIAPVPVTAGR